MYLPHQFIEHQLQHRFDQTIRRNYFRGMEFAGPAGDPGWFGPGSAVWHVHSHTEALVFGLQCAAFIERLDPSIYWMGMHHSRLVQRDENGEAVPVIDPKGAAVRLGHSIAFFIGTAYGSTETAENLARTVRAMHHTIKGVRPDGAAYDADDPDWLRFRLMGMTNPAYFALNARRRIDLYGATAEDFANVKVKNARHGLSNPNARYRKEVTVENVLASPVVSNPLHLLDICATSDGGAAILLTSMEYARKMGIAEPVRIKAISTVTPTFPQTIMDMPNFSTDSSSAVPAPERTFKESIGYAAYEEAGISPEDVDVAEVYDLATSVELDWIEDLALCKRGEAEHLLRAGDTSIGGRIPVNPSGGLACFGEAVPAQALAQVCELTWQLRGQAEGRQVEGARIGITANQGLFGHGSSVIVSA